MDGNRPFRPSEGGPRERSDSGGCPYVIPAKAGRLRGGTSIQRKAKHAEAPNLRQQTGEQKRLMQRRPLGEAWQGIYPLQVELRFDRVISLLRSLRKADKWRTMLAVLSPHSEWCTITTPKTA